MPENIRSELSHTSYNKASWGKDNMGAWCTGTKPSPVFEAAAGCFELQLMQVNTRVVVHHNMVKSTGCPSLPNGTGKVGGICYHAPSRPPHQHPYMVQQHPCIPRSRSRGSTWCFLRMPAMYNQWGSCTSSPMGVRSRRNCVLPISLFWALRDRWEVEPGGGFERDRLDGYYWLGVAWLAEIAGRRPQLRG